MIANPQASDSYLGREVERSYIDKCIRAQDTSRHVIYISGPGGVGKTALLEQILQDYPHPDAPNVVLATIDFDDLTLRLSDNLMERLARQLSGQEGRELFQEFWQIWDANDGHFAGQRRRQEEAKHAFVQGLQRVTQKKRLVLLVDTLEKAPIWSPEFLGDVVSEIQNVVIVLVGRPTSKRVEQEFEKKLLESDALPPFAIKSIAWKGLDAELCEAYFSSREEFKKFNIEATLLTVPISTNTEMQERIWHLAQGIPFQINLFIGLLRFLEIGNYQLTQHVNALLEEIQETQLETLKNDFELRQRFQQALIAPFVLNFDRSETRDEEENNTWLTSRILLLIAHINHYMAHALGGFDAEVLARLDEKLTEEQVQRGLKYIENNRKTQFSFVKLFYDADGNVDGIGLHDEMARMLNDLGWIRLDPPGLRHSIRDEISKKLVRYYDKRCLELYARDEEKAQIAQAAENESADLFGKIWWRAVSFPEGQALLLARTFHSIYRDFRAGWQWIYNLSEHIFRQSYFDALLYESVEAYIQATRIIRDVDIEACMNVWKAAALIARRDRAREHFSDAQRLLIDSIHIWKEKYQEDEEEIKKLEKTRSTLENLRQDVLARIRRNPQQTDQLQRTVVNLDQQLHDIETTIQAKTQFSDLERAHTSLGYVYRLEGKWEKAISHYNDALRYSRWLGNCENIAELANNIANVYLLWGKLTDAALYAQIGAIIRKHLGVKRELGNSYWILGMINWRIGNTYECRKYTNRARNCYEQPVDIARVDLYEGYTYYRIGDTEIGHKSLKKLPRLDDHDAQDTQYIPPVRSFPLLEQARKVFEEYEQVNDLAWTYNVLSRAYRRDGEFEKAEKAARKVLSLTQDHLRVAEANLSLCMLYYRWGLRKLENGDTEGGYKEFEKVDACYEEGFPLARDGQYISLMSVYEGVKGNVEYERGEKDPTYYQKAFRHYLHECQIAAQNKTLRFERALNEVVADRLARMPVDLALQCAEILTDFESWEAKGLGQKYQILKDEVDELKLFLGLPEKKQIDAMEASFNQLMRVGDYQSALAEAQNALQQFRRYNWSIDTVRVLLKTAQAYRKVTDFTSARRYCKQALLVIENLKKRLGPDDPPIELTTQKAQADFTMGRILWEIGNTAEAATHFRYAREVYLKYRDHETPAIAQQMREGLARSVQYEGIMRFRIGEFDQALEFLNWAAKEYREMNNVRRLAKVLNLQARIYRDRDTEGDIARARNALEEALRLILDVGDNYTIAECYLSYMILEYYESQKPQDMSERLKYLGQAEAWYQKGAPYAHENHYALLQAVYEGILGNVLFDRLMLENGAKRHVDLEPAFDQYLEECRWDAHFEKRRFFRSLDLLMPRLSQLSSNEIRYYNDYILKNWKAYAAEDKLPGQAQEGEPYSETATEYIDHMRKFCKIVEDFSEYIAKER